MRSIKKINIKNSPYYFFNGMVDIKSFDPSLLNTDKISFKSPDAVIYSIKYITMESLDHASIDSENPLYLIFNNVDKSTECNSIEKGNGDKYLNFASTDKTKEVLKKYTEL